MEPIPSSHSALLLDFWVYYSLLCLNCICSYGFSEEWSWVLTITVVSQMSKMQWLWGSHTLMRKLTWGSGYSCWFPAHLERFWFIDSGVEPRKGICSKWSIRLSCRWQGTWLQKKHGKTLSSHKSGNLFKITQLEKDKTKTWDPFPGSPDWTLKTGKPHCTFLDPMSTLVALVACEWL